jgi:hypothetical protein
MRRETPEGSGRATLGSWATPGPTRANQSTGITRHTHSAGRSNAYGVVEKVRLVEICMIVYCARAVALI